MKKIFTALIAIAVLTVFGTSGSWASTVAATGSIVNIAPPASVVPGALVSATQVWEFDEKQNFVLPSNLNVDITAPGTYLVAADLTPGVIPAGTKVSSHFLDYDNSAAGLASAPPGSVTFDKQIIGVVVQSANLDASDGVLGAAGTSYPAGGSSPDRGLELFAPINNFDVYDHVIVGCDSVSIQMQYLWSNSRPAGQWVDNIRVITGDRPCASISIVKATNGQDANTAPGPYIPVGGAISWTYVVQNTGLVALSNVIVTDNQGVAVSCPKTTLAPSESMTCTASGTAVAGQYENIGTVTGTPPDGRPNVTASDPSHYFGSDPKIDITKYVSVDSLTTWNDANTPPGPSANVGGSAYFSFTVVNTGNVLLTNITLTDDVYSTATCSVPSSLAPGASFFCMIGPFPIVEGTHTDTGTTTGTPPVGAPVQDTDKANYTGLLYFASCTPGYWKNHTSAWRVYSPSQAVSTVFNVPTSLDSYLRTSTLLQGLSFKGGSTLSGAAEILLRASIAALLNTSNGTTIYPLSTAQVISQVNSALASGDRATMTNLGSKLDDYNNGKCPLN